MPTDTPRRSDKAALTPEQALTELARALDLADVSYRHSSYHGQPCLQVWNPLCAGKPETVIAEEDSAGKLRFRTPPAGSVYGPVDDLQLVISCIGSRRARVREHERIREQVLPASKQTPPIVRATVERTLREWGFGGEEVEHAQMIMSELIVNAVIHAKVRDVWYRIERDGMRVLLAVWDTSPEDPNKVNPDDESESGRGLQIIEALSDKWGFDRDEFGPRGKWVWAVLNCKPAESCLRMS